MTNSYLVLEHLKINNANAISSYMTIGIPAVSAFMGAIHNLQRKINLISGFNISLTGVAIVIHDYKVKVQEGKYGKNSLILTKNPLKSDGTLPSIIEEGKIDFDTSLIIEYTDENMWLLKKGNQEFLDIVLSIIQKGFRIAGGDIQNIDAKQVYLWDINEGDKKQEAKLKCKLMPGFALLERRDLLIAEQKKGDDVLSAFIQSLAVINTCKQTEDGKGYWTKSRKYSGWIVPASVGYQGLVPLHKAIGQRDYNYQHTFAEDIITLCEYKIISSVDILQNIIWKPKVEVDKLLFKYCNN